MAMLPKRLLLEVDVLFLTRIHRLLSSKANQSQHFPVSARTRVKCLSEVHVSRRTKTSTVRHSFSNPVANVATASSAVCKRQLSAESDDDIPWFLDPQNPLEMVEHLDDGEREVQRGKQEVSGNLGSVKKASEKKNILSGRTIPRIDKLTKKQLLGRIQNRGIVYDDGHIVAINKLAGLPVQGQNPEQLSLNSLLPELGAALEAPDLSIVKPLDWHLSGIVLLARTPEARAEVFNVTKAATQRNKFYRKYWGVVIGTLDSPEGEIKCHLAQQKIGDHTMTVPVLNPTQAAVRRKEARNCLTRYKVLSQGQGYALVQLEPRQMFVDQLQVHLSTKLCSILGDHVYSSRVGSVAGMPALMEPTNVSPRTQRVPKDILKKMNLRAIQMHKVPVHLHCGEMVLPRYRGRDIKITAPLPKHFLWTLQLLGLKDPTHDL
ncbi:RPUSD3 [Branchiostoma lanceolatum]|uniref:Pseudouridylate synthase RPUSD4, mitochondrial n=1 Tax=Branchiostoma lanceolatum TaxID=7740 RepID=A0A8K0ET74_BRALA|nr:RPUSD3 [Branchiostoma lanceolatum]